MDTGSTSAGKSFQDFFKSGLELIQKEIEELAVQISLGKAEAGDKLEEMKKELRTAVQNFKKEIGEKTGLDSSESLKAKLEELIVQLNLGKAETRELIEEQIKKIRHSVGNLESQLRSENVITEKYSRFRSDIEKFKLKSEILSLKAQVKGIEINDMFHNEMKHAKEKFSKVMIRIDSRADQVKENLSDFNDEMEKVYTHLKSAVKSLAKS